MYSYQHKPDRTLTVASLARTVSSRSNSLYLEDNRPRSIVQKKQKHELNGIQGQTGTASCLQLADNRPRSVQLKKQAGVSPINRASLTALKMENKTGLPDQLKSGIENLSGYSMDDVKVHYNSSKPAQINAHAYAQGTDIHIASGQEKHLPHEAWHVVQQKQGRVKPTIQMKGEYINDTRALENEADEMGARAQQNVAPLRTTLKANFNAPGSRMDVIQGEFVRVRIAGRRGLFWRDNETGLIYEQAEVQVDDRIRLAGNGEDFYIYPSNGLWDRTNLNPLTERQSAAASEVLLGPAAAAQGDVPIPAANVNQQILTAMVGQLRAFVRVTLPQVRASDAPGVNLGPGSLYGMILRRAIQNILAVYGATIDAAALQQHDTTARDNLLNASLLHSTARWQGAGDEERQTAARLAVEWAMSNVDALLALVKEVQDAHQGSSEATVIATYCNALCLDPANGVLLNQMAEIRLRWGPITYGRNIFLEVRTAEMTAADQWWLYRTLIHEALHSVEHPRFTAFLENNIPPGLRSDIREGIVEYLTRRIWVRALREALRAGAGGQPNLPAADPAIPLRITRQQIDEITAVLRQNRAYVLQVRTIRRLVGILHNGDARLESAYFAGNVAALLPRLRENDDDDNADDE